MLRKAFKSLYVFALMLFAVGAIFLLPALNYKKSANADNGDISLSSNEVNEIEGLNQSVSLPNGNWSDALVDVSTMALNSQTFYINGNSSYKALTNVYVVTSATDLAYLAYAVNNYVENGKYNSATIALTTNIDLAGAFWTPIGTDDHPFAGVFLGQGFLVSNINTADIAIDSDTNSAVGLFGNITGSVSDLRIGGEFFANTTKSKVGALVGENRSGEIINCFDETTSKKLYKNNALQDAPVIGSNSGKVYKGTTIFNSTGGETASSQAISVNDTDVVGFYVITDGGVFKQANGAWYENRVRVCSSGGKVVEVKNPIYLDAQVGQTKGIVLRADAKDTDVYPLREGYKYSIPNVAIGKLNVTSSNGDDTKLKITFNYQYGQPNRTHELTVAYDTTFQTIISNNSYLNKRSGYNFLGIYSDSGFGSKLNHEGNDYKLAYPSSGQVIYPNFSAAGNLKYNIYIAIANGDKSNTQSGYDYITNAIVGDVTVVSGFGSVTKPEDTNKSHYNATTNGSNQGKVSITLANGYQIANVNGTGGSRDSDYVFNNKSGVYVDFKNATGTGTAYTTNNTNNDSYLPVSSGIESSGNTYTITINNIAGQNGDVYIVIERKTYELTFSPKFVDSHTTDKIVVSGEGVEGMKLTYKLFQTYTVTVTINDDEFVILDAKESVDKIGNYVDSESTGDAILDKYYKSYIYTIYVESANAAGDYTLVFRVGYIQSRVNIELHDENNQKIDTTKPEGKELGVSVNSRDLGFIGNGEGNFPFHKDGKDDFVVSKNNGYYTADNLFIDKNGNGVFEENEMVGTTFGTHDGDKENQSSIIMDNLITKIYDSEDPSSIIKIRVKYRRQQYSINTEVKVKNPSQTDYTILNGHNDLYNITIDGTSGESKNDLNNGVVYNVVIQLTERGKAILYDPLGSLGVEVTSGSDTDGFVSSKVETDASSNPDTGKWAFKVTLGTYNTKLTLHFTYKSVNLQINQLYVDDNEDGLDGALIDFAPVASTTFTFAYADGNISLNGSLSNIQIDSQYYLLDWYLKNGEYAGKVGATNFVTGLTEGKVLNDIISNSQSAVNDPSITYTNVAALVVKRTVKVILNSNDAGQGQIYYNSAFWAERQTHVISNGLTHATTLPIDSGIFKNLGYTFVDWTVNWGSGATSSNVKDNFVIQDANWDSLFGGESVHSWTGFATSDIGSATSKTSEVTLTANWQIITYTMVIDGNKTVTFNIGHELTMTVDEDAKNGIADYLINGQKVSGLGQTGYVAVSATISAIGGSGIVTITEDAGFIFKSTAITIDDFKKILTEEYYFKANSQSNPINVTTNREAADYKIYIDGSSSNYYSVSWNGDNNEFGGLDNTGVYINVTFDSKPENIQKAIDNANLVITREGYSIVSTSWKRTTGNLIDVNNNFTIASDIHVVPVWNKTSNTTKSNQDWASDVGTNKVFYLYNEHDVINGKMTGSNIGDKSQPEIDYILTNGEKITGFGYEITFTPKDGGNVETSTINSLNLNISNFLKAGTYQVIFFINVSDTLSESISYTEKSGVLTFTMEKNEIVFYGNDVHSYYTGTTEFVVVNEGEGGVNNEYGSFLYRYDWNGTDFSVSADKIEIGEVENYFQTMSIFESSGNYNAGGNKSLKLYLNIGALGNKYGTIYSDLFSNVTKDGNNYYTFMNTDSDSFVTIEKAKFTITFTSGSAYYFDGVTTIVYTNTSKIQFNSGASTFTYGYDNITLKPNAQPGIYKGAEDHATDSANFDINGLYIEGHESDLDSNFEWNISKNSSFELLDSKNAIQYNYSPKYLTAVSGKLVEGLADNYKQIYETLSIVDVMVNGSAVTIPNTNQYSYSVDNKVLFSFVNNNTNSLKIYINNELLSSGTKLSFGVEVNLSTDRSKTLSILSWGTSLNSADYESLLDSAFTGANPYIVTVAANSENKTTYAVMTDVVKLNLDYNGGKKDGKTSEVIYLSAMNGNLDITNPTHDYQGLSFNNYSNPKTSNITVTVSDGKNVIKVVKGGGAETLKASWNFDKIVASQTQTALTKKASVGGFSLGLNEWTNITYPDKTTNKTYTLTHDSINFNFNSNDNSFLIVNAIGLAEVSMSGDYVLNVSVTYNDGVQEPQTRTLTYTLDLTIEINTIGISKDDSHLTFNNSNQEGNVSVDVYLNGTKNETILLSALPIKDNSGSGKGFYVTTSSTKGYTQINQADTYTVTAVIDSSLTGVYTLESGKESITVVVDQDIINLKDYQDQINLSKVFGTNDPSPISATLTIKENANDSVKVEFTRDLGSGSEAIGQHLLTFSKISSADDEANYDVNTEGFEEYFEITVPETKLQVNLGGKLIYTYNGYVLNNLTVEFNGTNYTLKGTAGEEEIEIKFDMYYMAGTSRVEIPADQKEVYAGYVTFASANANKKEGTYDFNVSLSTTAEGGWSGVEIVNKDNAKIVVEKRTITVTGATKTFDQTSEFVYNNTSTASNTATLTIDNIVTVGDITDQIQVSGKFASELAGQQKITNITLDGVGEYENYVLEMTEGLEILVNPSTETIDVTSSVNSLQYGQITSQTSISNLLTLVPISYNGGQINNIYITAEGYEITNKVFSNGTYLNVNTWTFVYTMTSTNYTFGEEVGSVGQKYTKTYSLSITINPIAITINNAQGKTITKQYDGYANVLDSFVKQNVNASEGYYTSSGILPGDIITVDSAVYENEKIGNAKVITATLSGDNNNYTITQNIVGNITNVALIFNKYLETISWVDDGIDEFGNADPLNITYTGDLDAVINTILSVPSRATRVGYTQTGWTYNDVNMSSVDFDKEAFLQDAVDNKLTGITIDAVWEINQYTVQIDQGDNTVVSHDSVSFPKTVNYWDTISDIKVNANEGYTFENVTLNQNNATLSMTGQTTNKGTFTLTHITGDLTATIVSEEITVRIIIDYNNPESFIVDTDSAGWTGGVKDRILKYSELSSQDLPVLYVTTENTYDFDRWTNTSGSTSLGSNIWERIKNAGFDFDFTQDNLDGYTFKANWTEAELSITLNVGNNAQASLYMDSTSGTKLTAGSDGTYKIHYNDTVAVVVNSDDWYKWTNTTIQGNVVSITGDITSNNQATGKTDGQFVLNTIHSSLTLTIAIDGIDITFTTSYTKPAGADIIEGNGDITGVYDADQGDITLGNVIAYYNPEAGTYLQDYWINGDNEFTKNSVVKNLITSIYGSIPTEDISLELIAHFVGQEYTITFDKGTPKVGADGEPVEAEFVGDDAGKDPVTRTWIYGDIISNMPVVEAQGQNYSWVNNSGESYADGSQFITENPSSSLVMTLTANWTEIHYNVQISFAGKTDKITKVTVDDREYQENTNASALFNTNKSFVFTLETGYEIDAANTKILTDDHIADYEDAVLSVRGNTVTIRGIQGNITAQVSIKAKDYTITIQKETPENISKTSFDVSYDQDMTGFFSGTTFARDGYLINSLKSGASDFAVSADGGKNWTFNAPFVEDGVYKNDGDLVLKAYWSSQNNYVVAQTEPVVGLYFNGSSQKIANSTLSTIKGGETVAIGNTLANGDKVVDIYYMLDGKRYEIEADNSLLYRNVLADKDVYIVVALHDTLVDGTNSITYTIQSQVKKVTLSPSDITFKDTSLKTYYSGTENFNVTEDFSQGTWHYVDDTQITELTFAKVVIVDETGLYNIGDSYTVKYYFNATGEFDIANYTGLSKEGSYYVYTTDEVTATIVATPITITVSGMAFENGANQEVISYNIAKPDFVSGFDVEITYIETNGIIAGDYKTTEQFNITGTVKNGADDKTSNFVWVIAGSYTIVSSDEAYKVGTDVKYFDTKSIADKDDINVSLIKYSYNGTTAEISQDRNFFNLVADDKLIFSVSSNGTNAPLIQVANGETITFTFEIDGTMAVLTWTENLQVDSLISTLNLLDKEGSREYTQEFSNEATINAVLTDYKAVLLSLGDKGGNQGYIYVQLNGATAEAVVSEEWTGFEFARWDTVGSGVSAEGNIISAGADAKITTTTITAIWRLVAPTGDSVDEILRDAKASYDGMIDPINLSHLLTNGITNKNEDAITYSYSWQKGDEVLHTSEDGFTVLANTNSNGTYKLVITASRSGYNSKSAEFEFTLTINKLTITNVTLSSATFTYANKDFVPDITVSFEGDKLGFDNVNLALMLNHKDNLPYYFTLAGLSTTEIKNAGEYTLTLNLEPTIFNDYDFAPSVTVNRADLVISQTDVETEKMDSKLFGENDPAFSFKRTMFADGNPEEITIFLGRVAGEGVGTYNFNTVSSSSDENFNVTLNADGVIFTIKPSNFTLNIKINNIISMVYNGGTPTFVTEYSEEQGAWIIKVENTSSTITLSYTADDGERYLSGELYKLALENISFAMSKAIDVSSYFGESFEVTAGEGANFTTFNVTGEFDITQRPLTIVKVEKVFDRNNLINDQTIVRFSNLIQNDEIILTGNFAQTVVGDQIALQNLALSGADANNYSIVNHDFKGVITPKAVTNVVVGVIESNHTYGNLSQSTLLQAFIDNVQGVTLSIDGETNDLTNGFATVSGWTVEEQYLSTSKNLKVGRDIVKIIISSDNFTGLAENGYEVTLVIQQLEIDLSTVAIVKNYDETTDMPKDLNTNINNYILTGDIVQIDKDASKYADSGVGTNIKVTLVLTGQDSANYKVKDNVTGIINEYSITFIVNATTEHNDLVSDGAFVEDGETPVVKETSFSFKYPATMTGEEIIKAMKYPSRKGYTPVGWKYLQGEEYISITAENVIDLLKQIANDETNIDSQVSIYTVWEIDRYSINVSGNNMAKFEVTGENVTGNAETGYSVRYFSDIAISVEGNRGYKVRAYNIAQGDNKGNDLSDVGNNTGTATINKVGSNVNFIVTFDEIEITINIDVNIPEYTERTDKENLTLTYKYSELASLTKENLPSLTVTNGTYYLSGYNYNDDIAINDETLKQIIDTIFPVLSSDEETTFKAVWTGENYTVTFDSQGGDLSGTNPINVVYGSAFTEKFPVAYIPGKSNIWVAPDGLSYVDGDIFHSIGTVNTDGGYKITLTAEWHNNPYDLTLEFNDKLSIITSDGDAVNTGDVFEIIYEEESLTIIVNPNQGYIFDVVNKDTFKGDVEIDGNKVTISNLTEDGTLTLTSLPDDNTLSISINYIDGYTVKVDGVPYEDEDLSRIIAKTESEVEITFNAKKGYEFDDTSAYLTGNGNIEFSISENKKTLTVTWKNYVDDATLTVTGVPSDNIVTIPDISSMFDSLTLNGQSINTKGDTFTIKTAQTLTIIGRLCYGYENAVMTSTLPEGSIISQINNWVNADKAFSFSGIIENIDENFEIAFTVDERTYNFVVMVTEGQEEFGSIVSEANVTAKFNGQITLEENTLRDDYIFAGWSIADTILSVDSKFTLNIDSSIKDLLESFEHDTEIYIYATYKEKIFTVSFKAGNRGEYTFSQDGSEETRVYGTNTIVRNLNLGSDIIIKLKADEGYEFDKLLIDEDEATEEQYTYNEDEQTITIPVPVNDPMTLIEVTFKASEAYVSVQAGIQINYDVNLGSNEGGNVYIANAQGEIFEEDSGLYLDNGGTLIVGADYKLKSYTDETIYFVAIPKSGFTASMKCLNNQVVMNEYDIGGVHVYSFSGVKDGMQVQAIFTAKENDVQIKYVVEGSTETVMGGRIVVDTSSAFVSASSNSTQDVSVGIITGADLIFTANSGIAYNLVTNEDGTLKYDIEYLGEDIFEGIITSGLVQESDIIMTGYSNTANFNITNVNTSAIIYLYVQPKTYNLKFYVNETQSVVLEDALIYGEEFSIAGLTEEERGIIFQQRSGFTLGGYFTKQLGQGKQYIDKDGNILSAWLEDGYTYNGTTYDPDANFSVIDNTFTIYAAWLYNKSSITINFVPEGFDNKLSDVEIDDIIVNINNTASWTNQDNKWYAEVVSGTSLKIQAYEYEGYEFKYWLISVDGGEPSIKASTFEMTFPQGNYVIEAIYHPKFTITIENLQNGSAIGGTSSLLQNGTVVTGISYDPAQQVTLEAVAQEGYKFLYWENTLTGERIYGQFDKASGKTTYAFENLISEPLYLKAVFEGKSVTINLDYSDVALHHELVGVYVNGELVDYDNPFIAKIGDEISIEVIKHLGYGFEMIGGNFVQSIASNGNIRFTYTLSVEELTVVDEDSYKLDLKFNSTREEIKFKFNIVVDDAIDETEFSKAGKLTFVDAEGKEHDTAGNNLFSTPFGKTVYLKVETFANYQITRIMLQIDLLNDITVLLDNGKIVIDENFMETYFAYEVEITVYFERLVWIDEEFRSTTLQGSGTENDPFLIHDAQDMAFVAYVVNNGIVLGDTNYADCYYRVTSDIDFSGKYWEPIGTEEHPFNGVMDLGGYQLRNILHYKSYSNPTTSYGGLFWHLTEKAQVIQNDYTLIIVLSVIGGLIFLLLLILLIILLVRRNKKKKLDEIANE